LNTPATICPAVLTVRLDDGSQLLVAKLTVADLAALARCIRQAVPEGGLDGLLGAEEAFSEAAIMRMIGRFALRFPELLAPLAGCVARRDPAEAAHWSPHDCLRLLTAALEVNDWPRMAEEMRSFFGAARRTLESVSASLAGSTRSSSS